MPASKGRYIIDDSVAAKVHSLKDMFEAPPAKKRKTQEDEDSSSAEDISQSKETEKREPQCIIYHEHLIICYSKQG